MPSARAFLVRERDGSGRVIARYTSETERSKSEPRAHERIVSVQKVSRLSGGRWHQLLRGVFLPEGYPATVSDDYLQYQIWNALQAFCSSLASLFSSRAVLQAHGVGNASASATNAILLNVLQDVFSRLTTIVSGYYLGTSLYPEAKTYRLLADIFNDVAIITDTLSPYLATVTLSSQYPYVVPTADSPLRIVALCLSGASRALCGAVAGGSKAALTVHFATAGERAGDVGDLSAKDGSKETVLALLGMLCGTVVVQYVHGPQETWAVLFVLIALHLAANVMAVRVISMRSFNRQRASIAWEVYRSSFDVHGTATSQAVVLPPATVSRREKIFRESSWIGQDKTVPARCMLGVPFAALREPCTGHSPSLLSFSSTTRLRQHALTDAETTAVLEAFTDEKYVLWFASAPSAAPRVVVALKDGHSPSDHLKAWAHAHELVRQCGGRTPTGFETQLLAVRGALECVSRMFPGFVEQAKAAGWKIEENALVGGSPVTMEIELLERVGEDKKNA
ncbi:vitamin B6 photo-protection and homoeostasis-domain-containing protein [Earliella scabrosa]|nr:vitamin B6 photo-protection and homoeostasis-domain-containing protein [Earliella scabrosa]